MSQDTVKEQDSKPWRLTTLWRKVTMDGMPDAIIGVDWKQVQDLYLEGYPIKEIAAETGATPSAIQCKASREGWTTLRKRTKFLAREKLVELWEDRMVSSILKDADEWAKGDLPKEPRARKDWEQARAFHIQAARTLLGLDVLEKEVAGWAAKKAVVIDVPTQLLSPSTDSGAVAQSTQLPKPEPHTTEGK